MIVSRWADHTGRASWTEGVRPTALLVAAFTYWPPATVLWLVLFPGESRRLPWDDDQD